MRISQTCTTLILLAALSACASQSIEASDADKAWVFSTRVASSDKFEIQSSELALDRSRASPVRQVAQQMIDDHTKSDQKFMALLAAGHMKNPPPSLSPYHMRSLASLKDSTNFDCDYLSAQEAGHEQAIAMFDSYSVYGHQAALRGFAADTLPVLQAHLQMIQNARNSVSCR